MKIENTNKEGLKKEGIKEIDLKNERIKNLGSNLISEKGSGLNRNTSSSFDDNQNANLSDTSLPKSDFLNIEYNPSLKN